MKIKKKKSKKKPETDSIANVAKETSQSQGKKLVRKGTMSSKYNVDKIKKIAGDANSVANDEENNVGSFNEFVEDEELENPKIKKQSRRRKVKNNRERRYSRITLGKELILSKTSGLRLQWAINKS